MSLKVQPVVVIGGGGHGKVLLHVLERLPQFAVLGYLDPQDRGSVLGHPWLGNDEAAAALLQKHPGLGAVLGIGKVRAQSNRMAIFQKFARLGFFFPPIVAPSAVVARDVLLGDGTVVLDGAILQPGCRLGNLCIVNTRATLDHDCTLGHDVHIATGAALSGEVSVEDGSLLGTGAACIQGIRIAPGCTVGAGAAVVTSCLEAGTYLGVPARRQKA